MDPPVHRPIRKRQLAIQLVSILFASRQLEPDRWISGPDCLRHPLRRIVDPLSAPHHNLFPVHHLACRARQPILFPWYFLEPVHIRFIMTRTVLHRTLRIPPPCSSNRRCILGTPRLRKCGKQKTSTGKEGVKTTHDTCAVGRTGMWRVSS